MHPPKYQPFLLYQIPNPDFVVTLVHSVPARIGSRAAGVEFLCAPTEDLPVGHDRQGAGIRLAVLREHSHAHAQL